MQPIKNLMTIQTDKIPGTRHSVWLVIPPSLFLLDERGFVFLAC